MSRSIAAGAHAKVNITLEVLGRREDGYHELRSVFALIGLCDRVRVSTSRDLVVRMAPHPGSSHGDDLASRAVRAFATAAGRDPRARVIVRKRIPVAAGLGGGSSDAGATMRALAALWRAAPPTAELAAGVGSDVPFFVSGAGFALVAGRGERVEPLPAPRGQLWITLVIPRTRQPTAAVFAALEQGEHGDGSRTAGLARAFHEHRAEPATLRTLAVNDLLAAAERTCPEIAETRARAAAKGVTLILSGSGPALFAVGDSRRDALRIARVLRALGMRSRAYPLGAAASERAAFL